MAEFGVDQWRKTTRFYSNADSLSTLNCQPTAKVMPEEDDAYYVSFA